MRVGVFGGFCLLACLLSVGLTEEFGDSKQSSESGTDQKEIEKSIESDSRRVNDDVRESKELSTDLKAEENATNVHSLEEGLNSSKEIRNESQNTGDTSSSKESFNNQSLSDFLARSKVPALPEPVVPKSSSHFMDSQFAIQLSLMDDQLPPLEGKNKEPDSYFNNESYITQGFVAAPADTLSPKSSSEILDPLYQANNLKEYPPKQSTHFHNPRDKTRRNSNNDDLYSETMNSYPFTPLSDSGSKESEDLRTGAPDAPSYPLYQNLGSGSAQAYASAQVQHDLNAHNQGLNPYSFGYPRPITNSGSLASAAANIGSASSQGLVGVIDDAKSRLIYPHEYIFLHKTPGGENAVQCTRENELHHFWSQAFDCLICICLNEYGLLEPVCVSCSGCRNPPLRIPPLPPKMPEPIPPKSQTLEPYVPLPIPDEPYEPHHIPDFEPNAPSASAPSLIAEPGIELELTTPLPLRDAPIGCNPLPTELEFEHPLNPCQMCVCKELMNVNGKIEVRIECQDSTECVLQPDTTTLPPIPDEPVPVPLPLCEKFPQHVLFPHPKENCKKCKCSIEKGANGIPEQQITCFQDTSNSSCVTTESTRNPTTPPAPPIPIPVEPYSGPGPEPVAEPVPENFPPSPNPVSPKEPLPWPPISTPPPPPIPLKPKKGPLPGPSPHESCRPYPPNHPFQHPWDECQICECSEVTAVGMVNVEISCYTKISCCIESPEQAISVIAGKFNSKASGGPHGEDSQAIAYVNDYPTSTFKPPAFSPGVRQSQAYVATNVISPSDTDNPVYQYLSNSQTTTEASPEYKPQIFIPTDSQNQVYAQANSIVQNTQNNPAYIVPKPYQSVNAYGSVGNAGSQSSAEVTNAEYNIIPISTNNLSPSYSSFTPGIGQKPLSNPNYQVPGLYPSVAQAISSASNGGASSEASEDYLPMAITYKPALLYPPYSTGIAQNQPYADANAQYNRPVTTTFKPPSLYGQYNPDISSNQAYAEALAQYNELMASTQKPPSLYGQYNPAISQNQVHSPANAQYSNFITTTIKPPTLYNPYYNQEAFQSQVYAQANAQYSGLVTSTPRPTALYGQYNPTVSQNQIYPSPNAMYTGSLTATDKPVPSFQQYPPGVSQSQAYAAANAQNSGYYISSPYQSAKATSNSNGADQSAAVVEAVAQSQDYPPYIPAGSQTGANGISNPSSVYPYQSNYYTGYLSPQFSTYPARPTDTGLDNYKPNQIQYAGNYEFNGKPDTISVLSPQSGYYPYTSGYSQGIAASNMYPSLYPKQSGYDISSLYRPGQYGGSNAQNIAQAYAVTKMQSKSGEGNPEDSEDAK